MKKIISIVHKIQYIMNRPQKLLCFIVFAMSFLGSLLESVGVTAMIPLVGIIADQSMLRDSSFFRRFPLFSSLPYNKLVLIVSAGVIFIYIFKNIYLIFLSWTRAKFSSKIQREMTIKMMASYMSRGYSFFLTTNMGEIMRGVSGDASAVYTVLNALFRVLSDVMTMIFISIVLVTADSSFALIIISMALISILLIYKLFRRRMYRVGVRMREYAARSNQALFQAFEGIKDVLILRKQKYFISEYEKNQIECQKAMCSQAVGMESPSYIIEGVCITGLMIAICARILIKGTGSEFVAVLATFAVGAFKILPSIGRISASTSSIISSAASIDAMYEHAIEAEQFGREHPELRVEDERDVSTRFISKQFVYRDEAPKIYREKFNDSLCFKNVSFRYNEEVGDILSDVSFEIKKGQSVAFIGSSGAGKSTLVDILLGLLVPQKGEILIDGHRITEKPDKWSQTVGYVPQSVYLADASIKENVAFGERIDRIDIDRVNKVLEKAELCDFISSLPEGIDTFVGDRGVRLSGGQRQRIAIARALYHDPEIMVLDEATSALDNDTEEAVMSAIDALQGKVTLVIVAHRLTTIRNCDVIFEVRDRGIILKNKGEVLSEISNDED